MIGNVGSIFKREVVGSCCLQLDGEPLKSSDLWGHVGGEGCPVQKPRGWGGDRKMEQEGWVDARMVLSGESGKELCPEKEWAVVLHATGKSRIIDERPLGVVIPQWWWEITERAVQHMVSTWGHRLWAVLLRSLILKEWEDGRWTFLFVLRWVNSSGPKYHKWLNLSEYTVSWCLPLPHQPFLKKKWLKEEHHLLLSSFQDSFCSQFFCAWHDYGFGSASGLSWQPVRWYQMCAVVKQLLPAVVASAKLGTHISPHLSLHSVGKKYISDLEFQMVYKCGT